MTFNPLSSCSCYLRAFAGRIVIGHSARRLSSLHSELSDWLGQGGQAGEVTEDEEPLAGLGEAGHER